MSTVHSIHLSTDVIERLRRRPRVTSTNAKNVRDVFLYNARLNLFIPVAINAYNHHMNGADVANQRRKHLTTQRKHNLRTWRPLFHWLLDITLTNCFILWRLQARRKDPRVDWDPVEFNRALRDSLFAINLSQEHSPEIDQPITNSSRQATEVCGVNPEITEASRRVKYQVTQRKIPSKRIRGVLLGVPKRVEAATNIQAIEHAHSHTMIRVDDSKRRDCWGCQIMGRPPRPRSKTSSGGRPPLQDITNKQGEKKWAKRVKAKCLQCDAPLCVHGGCWETYHNSKKFS
jgi:hypothetical protein